MIAPQIKLMIVDDHQMIINGFIGLLNGISHIEIVAQANNGQQALEKLIDVKPHIVITDVEMPVMNGFELVQKIQKNYPDIKVLALSTYDEKSIVLKMLEAGAKGYILKNIKTDELVLAIESIARGKEYFSSEMLFTFNKPTADDLFRASGSVSPGNLSGREVEVLQLIVQGLTNPQIAESLFISVKTVEGHRTSLMKKLNVHNVAGLIRYAMQHKLV